MKKTTKYLLLFLILLLICGGTIGGGIIMQSNAIDDLANREDKTDKSISYKYFIGLALITLGASIGGCIFGYSSGVLKNTELDFFGQKVKD